METDFERQDVFDSRDVEERIKELEEMEERDEDEQEELKELLAFKEEVETTEWDYGETFIHDSYFNEYAQELFDDCYSHNVHESVRNYIDYDAFAEDLKHDYTYANLGGETFWFRNVWGRRMNKKDKIRVFKVVCSGDKEDALRLIEEGIYKDYEVESWTKKIKQTELKN